MTDGVYNYTQIDRMVDTTTANQHQELHHDYVVTIITISSKVHIVGDFRGLAVLLSKLQNTSSSMPHPVSVRTYGKPKEKKIHQCGSYVH